MSRVNLIVLIIFAGFFIIFSNQNIFAQSFNLAEFESFTGIKGGNFSTIIPQKIIRFDDAEDIRKANITEKDEALENSYPSEIVFIENQNYVNPTQATVIPEGKILDANETSNLTNLSLFACNSCYVTYRPKDELASNETMISELSDINMASNETIPVDQTSNIYNVQMQKIDIQNENISKTLVSEPTIAKHGQTLIFLNNYYGARSTDNGKSWKLFNMDADKNMEICCDQRLLYDKKHNIFVWYAQGEINNFTNINKNRIGISRDGYTWIMYYFEPKDIRPELKNTFFDFPYLVAGNDYLYLLTTVGSKNHLHGIVLRIALNGLSSCDPTSISADELRNCGAKFDYYYSLKKPNFAPIVPVDDTFYWAAHISNNKVRLYEWNENSTFEHIKNYTISIPSWATLRKNNSACNPADQILEENWCLRTDSRILTGWKSGNNLGFFWNANYNSTTQTNKIFQFPYINGATFEIGTEGLRYKGRPYIYNSGTTFLYPAVTVNSNGEVGMLAYYGEEVLKPSIIFGTTEHIDKNFPWDIQVLKKSSHVPRVYYDEKRDIKSWGDFTTLYSDGTSWYGTAFVLEGGNSNQNIQPYYIVIDKN